MATGYEDIDKLTSNQNQMLDESLKKQEEIINNQTQMQIDELEKNKTEIDQQTAKTNQGLYTQYKKASNPYGTNAEEMFTQGLGNSGYSETSKTNLYNTYQKNVTETINNAQKLKSDFDFQINQARQTGDITLAQNALEIYNQKMQLLTQEYELKNNREQFLYQKEQDALAQSNWEKEWLYQQQRDQIADSQWQQTFDYQKQRDQVADSQWAKEYALSQRKSTSSRSNSGGSGSSINASDGNSVNTMNNGISEYANQYLERVKYLQSLGNSSNENLEKAIVNQVTNGNISEDEAAYICYELGI